MWGMLVAWAWVVAVEVMRGEWMLGTFRRQETQPSGLANGLGVRE